MNVLPAFTVNVPVLLKLVAVVVNAVLPPIVSFPVLFARLASAFVLLDVFSIVPPASVRFVALVVIVCAVPVMSRLESRT